LFGAWRWSTRAPLSPESLVARGEVALGLPDGTWRAADEEERFHGLHFDGPALRVATPQDAQLVLLVASGRVELDRSSELELVREASDVSALLARGAATFVSYDERRVLPRGVRTALRPLTTPAPGTRANTREPAPEVASPTVLPEPPLVPRARTFAGHVTSADEGAAIASFTIGLLRERVVNRAHPPTLRTFEDGAGFFTWEDPPAGRQRVFVHADGFALRALGEFDFTTEPPELLVELERGLAIQGSVLDVEGNPVSGALVYAEDEVPSDGLLFVHSEHYYWLPVHARTGADGRFLLANLAPGAHTLRVEAVGYACARSESVQALPTPQDVTLKLKPGGAIAGRVERDDGGPWAESEVVVVAMDRDTLTRQTASVAKTDLDGRFRIEHLPPTTMLALVMRGERPDVRPVLVLEGRTSQVDFLAPHHGVRLEGRLFDREHRPCPGRNLGLFDAETATWNENWIASSTDTEGRYSFDGVRPGRYALYLVDDLGLGLRSIDTVVLEASPSVVQRDLAKPEGRLRITLRSAQDGRAQAGNLILLRQDSLDEPSFAAYGAAGPDGGADLIELGPGRYRAVAYPVTEGLGFTSSDWFELALDETAELALEFGTGNAVEVRARSEDGLDLEGATVVFFDARGTDHHFSRSPRTDTNGRFCAQGLALGPYRVVVAKEGFRTTEAFFDCEPGRELVVPAVLTPSSTPR
jgi:hypothetical protein